MGIQGDMFSNEAKQAVERLPKVSGSGQLYISSDLNKVLISGEDEARPWVMNMYPWSTCSCLF